MPKKNSGALLLGKKKKTDIGGQLPIFVFDHPMKAMNFPFHRIKEITYTQNCAYGSDGLWASVKSLYGCHMKNLCSSGQALPLFLCVNSVDADPWGKVL